MNRIVVVSLSSIETTNQRVFLHFQDAFGRRYSKTYPLHTFLAMARLIRLGGSDTRRGLLGLEWEPDGVGDRLVTTLSGDTQANMGDYRSHGPARQLAVILHPQNAIGTRLLAALEKKQPTYIKDLLDV